MPLTCLLTDITANLASLSRVITASKSVNAELFHGAAGALGTLGIITKLELSLIPAKRFVKIIYHPFQNTRDTIAAVQGATNRPDTDYVDAILFSHTHGILMTGQLVDELPPYTHPQTFSGSWDPWFYLHTKNKPLHCC